MKDGRELKPSATLVRFIGVNDADPVLEMRVSAFGSSSGGDWVVVGRGRIGTPKAACGREAVRSDEEPSAVAGRRRGRSLLLAPPGGEGGGVEGARE